MGATSIANLAKLPRPLVASAIVSIPLATLPVADAIFPIFPIIDPN